MICKILVIKHMKNTIHPHDSADESADEFIHWMDSSTELRGLHEDYTRMTRG